MFCGTPPSGSRYVSKSSACFWTLPPIGFCLSVCILFCHIWLFSLEACSFLKANRGSNGSGALVIVEGGKTTLRMYCMGEDQIKGTNYIELSVVEHP